ncbi:methyltransferase domain-containing protein [Desulfonatronospira sp.]|uniref:class I SAM-dependent methyltransferase n=1 Tax=Desulfonatronospira sp. TaxID=1962951 RepID=UPI0025C41D9B|nr:methyltransferase domain-containing protein [Desulfonatronospira sp.]
MQGLSQVLNLKLAGHRIKLKRQADLETLWSGLGEPAGDMDQERIPYWAEIWPSSVLLAEHLTLCRALIRGRLCLEVGCGLGATSILASRLGARLVAVDMEPDALRFARQSARTNNAPDVLWAGMDWKQSGLKNHVFEFIWAADVLYETGFALPLAGFFRDCLAPGGRIWIADQKRNVSANAWAGLLSQGFKARELEERRVSWFGQKPRVRLVELVRE